MSTSGSYIAFNANLHYLSDAEIAKILIMNRGP